MLDGPAVLGWEDWHQIDATHAVGQIQAGLESMMESGIVARSPAGPLAHVLHGAILEADLYVAVSEDPVSVWDGLERLLEGLLENRGTE